MNASKASRPDGIRKARGTPDPRRLAENRGHVAFLLSEFTVPHLLSTHKAFRGDMVMAIVLGEIGQHNVRRYFLDPAFKPGTGAEKVLVARMLRRETVSGCNALSISRATGLARETVRRKVVKLMRRGWIVRDARRQLQIAPDIAAQFGRFNDVSLATFLDVAHALQEVLDITTDRPAPKATGPAGARSAR
jgi:hypothetical protein